MALILRPLGLALSLLVVGCSTGESPTIPSAAAGGPTGNGARGAVDLEIFAAQGQTCAIGDVHVDIGLASASPPQEAADGADGVSLDCMISPKDLPMPDAGQPYGAQGSFKKGPLVFSFSTELTSDVSSMTGGQLHVADPKTGTDYSSTSCTFEFTPGTNDQLASGKFQAQFACNMLVSAANPSDTCSAHLGYVLLENCASAAQ